MSARVTIDRRDAGSENHLVYLNQLLPAAPTPAVRSLRGGAEPGEQLPGLGVQSPVSLGSAAAADWRGWGWGGGGRGAGPRGASLQVQAALLCLSGLRLRGLSATVLSQLNA